jgi:hypothetical protein
MTTGTRSEESGKSALFIKILNGVVVTPRLLIIDHRLVRTALPERPSPA